MLVTVPTTISAISDPFTRIKTLVFDLGLFLFDVVSDIYNGVNFMDGGNPIWGWTVIGLIFLPMTVFYAWLTFEKLLKSSSWWQRLLILVLAPLLAPIAIPLLTVFYIVYVAFNNARKVVQPGHFKEWV